MVRRPLCLACAAFVLFLMLLLTVFPPAPFSLAKIEGKTVTLQGRVVKKEWKSGRLNLILDRITTNESTYFVRRPKQILCRMAKGEGQSGTEKLGSHINITGRASSFSNAGNPGEFDAAGYYQARGIDFQLQDTRNHGIIYQKNTLEEVLYQFRYRLQEVYDAIFEPKQSGVMKAMVLGDATSLDMQIKEMYQKSGIAHLLVISGQHISMIGMGLFFLLRKSRIPQIYAAGLSFLMIYLYAVMTGMGSSTIRAITMFAIYLSAGLVNRTYDIITAMALTAVMILFWQPLMVFQPGFQLSFGAVMGIGLLYPVFQKLVKKKHSFLSLLLSSGSISYFTLPIMMYSFSTIPVYSILFNLIAVPLMSILLPIGIFLIPVFAFHTDLARFLSFPCKFILMLYEIVSNISTMIPGNSLITGRPEVFQIAIFYAGILALVLMHEYGNKICTVLMLAILLNILFWRTQVPCAITMIDVGQGDCILIEADGKNILIDAGSSTRQMTGQYQIIPTLKALGIRQLDLVVATHADKDHVSAIPELIAFCKEENGMKIKGLALSKKMKEEEGSVLLMQNARQARIPVIYLNKGDIIGGKEMQLICLNPEDSEFGTDPNEASIALWFDYKNFNALLTGDITGTGEMKMIKEIQAMENSGENIKVDYLKISHHGSEHSTPSELLTLIAPSAAFISCGKDNSYGHPHPALIQRLLEEQIPYFTTSTSGQIRVITDGETVIVKRWFK